VTDGPATLRVATWNIHADIGPEKPFPDRWWRLIDPDRLRAIGDFIAGLGADVVALQEVALASRDGDLVDNAGDLARQLGMEVRYGATRTFVVTDEAGSATGAGCFGNALLSRRPIGPSRAFMLPMATADAFVEPAGANHPAAGVRYADAPEGIHEPRTLLLARIGGMTVASTHFSHEGSGERALQAAATADALRGDGPALLLGDLNAPIESPELAPFGAWVDGFAEAGIPPGDERRVSTDDGVRIDHVLARDASVQGCRVLREAGELSDHYPVVADVVPRGGPAPEPANR
jgi:endonuclease/exonuclease/phosphatase family metal-dependent hydrolase